MKVSNSPTTSAAELRRGTARGTSRDQRASCLVLAILAAITFQVARQWDDDERVKYVVDLIATVVGATSLFWIGRRDPLNTPHLPPRLATWLAAFLFLPAIVESALRQFAGAGDALEIVMLVCLRNAALGTAAFARRPAQARLSSVFSGFLTLFSVSISDGKAAYVPAAIFSAIGLWSLMGAYWDRLQGKLAADSRRQTPLRLGVLSAVCGLLAVCAVFVAGSRRELFALPGFMPTSGGQKESDPYAPQGIGDGDMLAAAKDQAMTFGPVDSEQFLQSDMPSLYDMLDDRYGEPTVKPRQVRRAVALSGSKSINPPKNPSASKRSGREFAAARRKLQNRSTQPRGTESKALIYVLGEVPVHLALETYDTFDGATWIHGAVKAPNSPLVLKTVGDRPWFEFPASPKEWVLAQERHAVKVVNLRSARYPSPPLLTAVLIDRVNRADLFGWSSDGVLQIEGQESVPQFTVIHLVSNVLGADAVRTYAFRDAATAENDDYLQSPDVGSVAEAKKLAELWTLKVAPGWPQVESIIAGLRSGFVHDEAAVAPPGCADVVGHFLKSRRGPDYLFASTAALLLRSCGYPTRLVTGFYADPKRYDRRAGQTAVLKDDAHTWLEVGVARGTWVPVEPTPDFEPPRMVRTWREFAWTLAVSLGRWMRTEWRLIAVAASLALIMVWQRRRLLDIAASLTWRTALLGGARPALLATVRLLECRARLAGCSRPQNKTLLAWHGPWLTAIRGDASGSGSRLMFLINWSLYAPRSVEVPLPPAQVKQICREAVRSASLKTMRDARSGLCPANERS
jgi:protein-glutamine gamma-glutamyltransferase